MNPERVIRLLEARPFTPFVIYVNGTEDSELIDDPARVKIEDEGETLILSPRKASTSQRWMKVIDLRLVVAVAVQVGKHEQDT